MNELNKNIYRITEVFKLSKKIDCKTVVFEGVQQLALESNTDFEHKPKISPAIKVSSML